MGQLDQADGAAGGSPGDRNDARVERGEPVLFPADAADSTRTVSARAIATAVRAGRPVEVSRAIVTGALELTDVDCKEHVRLCDCTVEAVDVTYARFFKGASLAGTAIAHDLRSTRATYSRTLDLTGVRVGGTTDLSSVTFADDLCAKGAVFTADVDLTKAKADGDLDFTGASFGESGARFDGMEVGHDALLRNTTFAGPLSIYRAKVTGGLDLSDATIAGSGGCAQSSVAGDVNLTRAHFHGAQADFESISVGQHLTARCAEFDTEARFIGANVGGQAQFQGAWFTKPATFEALDVRGSGFFSTATARGIDRPVRFMQAVDFFGASFGGNLDLAGVRFSAFAGFRRLCVRRDLIAVGTYFGERANFRDADVGNEARFSGATFIGFANFSRMKVATALVFLDVCDDGGNVVTPAAAFAGSLDFTMMNVRENLYFRNVEVRGDARFERLEIGGSALFWNVKFFGTTSFLQAHLGEFAVFHGSRFARGLDLRLAHTTTLVFNAARESPDDELRYRDDLIVAKEPDGGENQTVLVRVDLNGCRYDRLSAYVSPLLDAVPDTDRSSYLQIERVLRATGNDELANDVYYRRRTTEGRAVRFPRAGFWSDRIVRATTGYGVRPWRVAMTAVVLVLAGTIGFEFPGTARPKAPESAPKTVAQQTDEQYCARPRAPDPGTAFWLAVKTASPVDLPPESGWSPVACPMPFTGWKNYYFSALLRALGVVFIGLTTASLTGLLRYIGNRDAGG